MKTYEDLLKVYRDTYYQIKEGKLKEASEVLSRETVAYWERIH